MLPKINGKSFLECTEEDLKAVVNNSDFRENEYIDYKQDFPFLKMPKGKERDKKISEFKNDVCAFANADGGYLIYGLSDENGCASEILGIDIPNNDVDKFELDRRNNLSTINPKPPYTKFHFIKLKNNKYVIIIYVKHDSFAPYIHLGDGENYNIYKRYGNQKQTMPYSELKNMFIQSISLDKEIHNYRKERIEYYRKREYNDLFQFILFHIIPETFLDTSYNMNMTVLERINNINFSSIFAPFGCSFSTPCVDGLRFLNYSLDNKKIFSDTECYIYNNGIVECYCPLNGIVNTYQSYPNGLIDWEYIWETFIQLYNKYTSIFKDLNENKKLYVCISILGCKDVVSFGDIVRQFTIDRNTILCSPVSIENINNDDENTLLIKKLEIEYLLSMGIKNHEKLNQAIKEVYNV